MNDELNRKLRQRRNQLVQRNQRYARWQRRWAEILTTILFIYVMLPFAAPTLMKVGATAPANALYTLYSPLCHQFAFRSMFLFGEQTFYPRETAQVESLVSFDERATQSAAFLALYTDKRQNELYNTFGAAAAEGYQFQPEELQEWTTAMILAARSFKGDEQMGYKVALCARDIMIYVAMVLGGVIFLFVRRWLRPAPLYLYVILGLGPIGLDGFSQLLSYPPFELWEPRESIPLFRMLTGALFGMMNIWLAFPYLEKSMLESAREKEMLIESIAEEE